MTIRFGDDSLLLGPNLGASSPRKHCSADHITFTCYHDHICHDTAINHEAQCQHSMVHECRKLGAVSRKHPEKTIPDLEGRFASLRIRPSVHHREVRTSSARYP
mmetsp:Transcript_11672/g.27740  ORF Transcript_11672/g.27740 Transcript_11672/m.27740 type:complete len:104 (+) Transcript_11672:289-600(+)